MEPESSVIVDGNFCICLTCTVIALFNYMKKPISKLKALKAMTSNFQSPAKKPNW